MKKLAEVLKDWEAVIGLEVHAELTTLNTKMFCNCRLSHDDEPNANICPVCLGLPGALPIPNEEAIKSIVMAGLATNCEIMRCSMFYRKHYFYPDMAKNFQTTQGPVAFCMHGYLDLEVPAAQAGERQDAGVERKSDGSYDTRVRILRIHMEEDAAKMVHVGGEEGRIGGATKSYIDYNRCGTPLIELVTEPDLRTPEEARLFMERLRETYLALGISDCSMEKGSLRCDGNVSIRRRGTSELGTKTEMKNINSFKSLHDALEYEICRQAEVLESGGHVLQETRHFEPAHKRTMVMRVKETADDYRLFPDPDLVPFDLSDDFIEACRERLPELPAEKKQRYIDDFDLKASDASLIAANPVNSKLFEEAVALGSASAAMVANVMVNLLSGEQSLSSAQLASLAKLLSEDAISFAQARELIDELARSGADPEKLVDERGLRQTTDTGELEATVDAVLTECTDQVEQYKSGNTKVLGYLVGQCMKASRGSGNPKLFSQILEQKLS